MMAEILRQGQAHMMRGLDAVRLSTGEDDDETDDPRDPSGWSAPAVLRQFFKNFGPLPVGGGDAEHRQFLVRGRQRHYEFAIEARGGVPHVEDLNTLEAAESYLKPYLFSEVGDDGDGADSHDNGASDAGEAKDGNNDGGDGGAGSSDTHDTGAYGGAGAGAGAGSDNGDARIPRTAIPAI
ncbi:unnamed protein product, partial [Pylaiella littoralis]